MPNNKSSNYPSSSEVVRNISDLRTRFEILDDQGKFRIVRMDPPYFAGSEFWVVNEKGFLWEPVDSIEAAYEYLQTPEAVEYNLLPT